MAREYFCAYHSYLKSMRNLSEAECGRLFRALLMYSAGDKSINLQGREAVAFDFMAEQIDRDSEAYAEKCQIRREAGQKGGRPKKQKNQMVFSESKKTQGKGKGKGEGEEKGKGELNPPLSPLAGGSAPHGSQGASRFSPPSLDEVRAYCAEQGFSMDPSAFYDHFTSNGWKVGGKAPMKDWKAAVRNWERRKFGQNKQQEGWSFDDF